MEFDKSMSHKKLYFVIKLAKKIECREYDRARVGDN